MKNPDKLKTQSVVPALPNEAGKESTDANALRCQDVTSKRGGASLKDLGRQYCAVTKMDAMFIPSIMQRI